MIASHDDPDEALSTGTAKARAQPIQLLCQQKSCNCVVIKCEQIDAITTNEVHVDQLNPEVH